MASSRQNSQCNVSARIIAVQTNRKHTKFIRLQCSVFTISEKCQCSIEIFSFLCIAFLHSSFFLSFFFFLVAYKYKVLFSCEHCVVDLFHSLEDFLTSGRK